MRFEASSSVTQKAFVGEMTGGKEYLTVVNLKIDLYSV